MSVKPLVEVNLNAKDFASDQDVRWCPGCGDYSILAQTKKVLAKLGVRREEVVFGRRSFRRAITASRSPESCSMSGVGFSPARNTHRRSWSAVHGRGNCT